MSLFRASVSGNLVRVRELLIGMSDGVDYNIVDGDGRTPLWLASERGHLEVVRELLRAGADPNIADKNNKTPLYWASCHGYLDVVKKLLLAGADPTIPDKHGRTPLYWAIDEEHLDVVKELENYFPSLHILSLRNIRNFKIDFSSIPKSLL